MRTDDFFGEFSEAVWGAGTAGGEGDSDAAQNFMASFHKTSALIYTRPVRKSKP